MKIIHTDIYGELANFLIDEAREQIKSGKKIFYIVPSSLSFEKEKEILMRYNKGQDGALFDLTVTRLKQLPWYFDKNQETDNQTLSSVGLAMLMRRTLKLLPDDKIPSYRFIKEKQGFIDQLVDLYQELITANLTSDDLLLTKDNQKNIELKAILDEFEYQLGHFSNENKLQHFIELLITDKVTSDLQDYVLIIEGYSRFSAEEMILIDTLSTRVSDIIFGIYTSKRALNASFIEGNIYQQSIELIRSLSQKYELTLIDKSVNKDKSLATNISLLMEKESDFSISDSDVLHDDGTVEIWQVVNHKEEIEHVAKQIRQLLFTGVQYKDILVLLGDVNADAILLPEIFKTYEIPFFYAQEKSMKDHPLIVLIEALVKIKKSNYRLQDVLSLLKTNLYTSDNISVDDIYKFEYYSLQRNIKGENKFKKTFDHVEAEKIRASLVGEQSPLQLLLSSRKSKGRTWVKKFQAFLETGLIQSSVEQLYVDAESAANFDKSSEHLEVWKLLMTVLEEFTAVFGLESLTVQEFLEIIESGIKNASYRLVPANVDVVQVKSYDLIEPHTADYVFAIGLTHANFPKQKQNVSLLSDEERATINQNIREHDHIKYIDEPVFINTKKNNFTALQLFNTANKKFVLSTPQLYSNEQSETSQFLNFLISRGLEPKLKHGINLNETVTHIGNYDGLLANLGEIQRQLLVHAEQTLEKKTTSFWLSLFRVMTKHPDYQFLLSAAKTDHLAQRHIQLPVMSALYPTDLNASVSSFESFYNCEYQYFIKQTLHIREFEKIDLDSRLSGSYFHEVFEKVMRDSQGSTQNFDKILTQTLHEVDEKYATYFTRDASSEYTQKKLKEIIKQTATIIKKTIANSGVHSLAFEQAFGFEKSNLETYQVALQQDKQLNLRGLIDRVDHIFNALGAVDYKSGDKKFDLQDVYDGTNLQFLTYLDILRQNASKFSTSPTIWGALYLHLQNPTIPLKSINDIKDIPDELKKLMKYTGFFNASLASDLKNNFDDLFNLGKFTKDNQPYKSNANFFSEQEISSMITHNETLYKAAGEKILSGEININPTVVKHHAKGCQFCQFKSICGFEPDIHLASGRPIHQKSKEEIRETLLMGGKDHASSH